MAEVQRMRKIKRENRTCKVAIYQFCSLHGSVPQQISYKSGRGVGKKQSILPFIECSVRWSHCNSIQTAQQSRALTLILINVNTTLILKIQENG